LLLKVANQKWGDRDFGEQLSEQIKTDASRMFALNELSKRESMNDLNAIQNKNAVGLPFSIENSLNSLNLAKAFNPVALKLNLFIACLISFLEHGD
jgi:hypothetical protein